MKGGKKKTAGEGSSGSDDVQLPPQSNEIGEDDDEEVTDSPTAGDAAAAVTDAVEEEDRGEEEMDGGEEEGENGEEEEDEEGEEGGKGFDEFGDLEIEDGVAKAEGTKLAEGFYEVEDIRRKRIRKGKVQYLIKWRGWPESANTWEPIENLASVPDIIEAFEESWSTGKPRRGRKRKYAVTSPSPSPSPNPNPQSKKNQQLSPTTATYNVPPVKVRIMEDPLPVPCLNNGCQNDYETFKQANENGAASMVFPQINGIKGQNESDEKLSELNANKFAVDFQDNAGRRVGARRRKSGSVKRFKQDPDPCLLNDTPGVPVRVTRSCSVVGKQGVQNLDFGRSGKNVCVITEIIKPISYSTSISRSGHDVSVTFMAKRSDGKEVMVDNKYLKSNNPLLLINFYEQHLRYSPT